MQRKHLIMLVVSLAFFFVTATTFTSLGLVLYTMVAELHWSQAAAGFSFSLLGLVCGLSSPLPALAMKWVGSRWTLFVGGLVLAAGFFLASLAQGIGLFFVATCLMGAGFTLLAPSSAVYLLANWFPQTSARMIGYYFMAGAFGGVIGPPVVGAIVSLSGDWRVHWRVMGVAAVVVGLLCLLAVRDLAKIRDVDEVRNAGAQQSGEAAPVPWTVREALGSRQFLVIAIALLVVQTAVTTMHSMLVTHVTLVGASKTAGAYAMSLLALSGTLTKGVTGRLAEHFESRQLLVAGLVLQCVSFVLLAAFAAPWAAFVFSLLFGIGWGLSWLSAHVLILKYFGSAIAGTMVAMATMATTLAVLGPYLAGVVADDRGNFIPVFVVFAGLLAIATLTTGLFLQPPRERHAADDTADAEDKPSSSAALAATLD